MRILPKSKKSRVIVAVVATAAIFAGGSAAYAYWSTTGSGTGAVSSATSTPITVVQTSVISNLAPGTAAQTLTGKFTNTNPGPVYVTSVTASIASVAKAVGAPAGTCDATDFTLSNATMPVAAEVPAGTNQGSWSGATIAFNDKGSTNQDACKLATVNFSYTVN